MWHDSCLEREFFASLVVVDRALVEAVQKRSCPKCGGALHRRDYVRKPRGGLLARAGEEFRIRFSLCCSRDGCRRSVLPPSLRFFGRRVYLEAVMLLACLWVLLGVPIKESKAITGVPEKTMRRWLSWWTSDFLSTSTWIWMRGRLMPPIDEALLPRSLLERVAMRIGESPGVGDVLTKAARWLAPLTTRSMSDVPRFVRAS